MFVICVAALNRNDVLFRARNGVPHKYGVTDYAEIGNSRQRAVKVISRCGFSDRFESNGIIARRLFCEIVSVSVTRGRTDVFGYFKSVRTCDSDFCGRSNAFPFRAVLSNA